MLAASEEVEPAQWEAGVVREDPHFASGVLLLRLGLAKDASDELEAIDPGRLREAGQATPDGVLLVAHLLDRAGDHRAAHNLLRTRARAALRRAPEGENLRAWRIAYPPAYRGDVRLAWSGGDPSCRVVATVICQACGEPLDARDTTPLTAGT